MAEKIVKDSQCLVNDLANDCISRQAAIDALDEIRHALWEIDIPSPTVPEYIEHHEQVQSVWKLLDKKQKELYAMPSVEAIPVEWIERKIARLKEMVNAFASLTAGQLQALLNDWRTEQDE